MLIQLKRINDACFPVQYNDNFYREVLQLPRQLNKLAYWNDFCVGAVCARICGGPPLRVCRQRSRSFHREQQTTRTEEASQDELERNDDEEPQSTGSNNARLYIMTLAVLAPYRGRGIASQLLQSILDFCQSPSCQQQYVSITEVALHVQISNKDAIRLYTDRFGFEIGEMIQNYYKRIDPPHCYPLYKKLVPARNHNSQDCDESD